MTTEQQLQRGERFRVVVLISGRGSNLQALWRAAQENDSGFVVAGVVSDKKAAEGLQFAALHDVPLSVVPRRSKEISEAQYNLSLAEEVSKFSPDLIVLAGYMRIVGPEFIRRFENRIINIHPSLLPAFPGLRAHAQALAAGVCFSGATVHFVIDAVDAGPIIAQAVVPVLPGDNEETLSDRILAQEHRLLPAVVRAMAHGSVSLTVHEQQRRVMVDDRFRAGSAQAALSSMR